MLIVMSLSWHNKMMLDGIPIRIGPFHCIDQFDPMDLSVATTDDKYVTRRSSSILLVVGLLVAVFY